MDKARNHTSNQVIGIFVFYLKNADEIKFFFS